MSRSTKIPVAMTLRATISDWFRQRLDWERLMLTSVIRCTALAVVLAASSIGFAQAPVFVTADSQPMLAADTVVGATRKVGAGTVRPSPVLMETRGHLHADGSVSTTCAAIPSSTPHSVSASRPITKQQER